ncbi:MAG: tRNA (adenosine(37)-N6)-threonylcarbamoyltransferase complex ATPase subunit type 1 TsaE [Christensenellaceae bacterium]|jgi:tRNA threonylcarbamoyladenosine biosynthesis protein TsaE|nr:tRNA (adenosine(37)-N6)-threonylcarbamoyltransferase complex ATPase subunit type 1 TsaE [Christensenellaceae bacterium]
MIFLQSNNLNQTNNIASLLSEYIAGGDVVLLQGELGAGKTTLASALIKALGVQATVVSPTYNIIKEYKGKLDIFHLDMYRIKSSDELYELGIEDCFSHDSLVIIEWNKLQNLTGRIISIEITTVDFNTRQFKITGLLDS